MRRSSCARCIPMVIADKVRRLVNFAQAPAYGGQLNLRGCRKGYAKSAHFLLLMLDGESQCREKSKRFARAVTRQTLL
jgi:hypothetical protein